MQSEIHWSTSLSNQPRRQSEILMGAGKRPSLTKRYICAVETDVRSATSLALSSFMGGSFRALPERDAAISVLRLIGQLTPLLRMFVIEKHEERLRRIILVGEFVVKIKRGPVLGAFFKVLNH